MDFLEYSDIQAEVKGAMTPGKLKLTDQHIIFKNSRTGKVEQISSSDLDLVNWQKLVGSWGLRIFLKNGTLHRFGGFKEGEQEKMAKFFTSNYKKDMLEKELSLKGWNWGTAKFVGSALSFDVGSLTAFEVPLSNVSQCTTGKNEVTLEFHQNDDAPVMNKASVISATGDAIAIFREIQCLTPRGRYDIKVFQSFFQLHGKTFDYKIPMSTVLRLFILPHKDGRQMFFVVSLDPPIKQGQTRYHFLVFLFGADEETSIELPFTDKVMKVLVNRKVTMPGQFVGHSGTPAVGCSYKAAAGYMYPLERGFIYIHKPPVHIRFEEISNVNFARSGGSTRSFDFEVETKSGVNHTFSSIEKEEYNKLYDFINNKKLRVKNRGKSDKPSYTEDFGDSDQEGEPDAYLARVKAEAEERDDDDGGSGGSDESEDEDFKPNEDVSDVAEEYDSNPTTSDSENISTIESEKPRKPRKKKEREEGKPKRPTTAFMLYLNENRERIKSKNPGIAFTEIPKKAGEMWRELSDKSEWEAKAAESKAEYEKAMKVYKESGGGAAKSGEGGSSSSKKESKSKSKAVVSPTKKTEKPASKKPKKEAKSEEEEMDVDSDSDTDKKKKSKKPAKKPEPKAKGKGKKKAGSSDEELEDEEEILSSPTASSESAEDSD
ncbi:hypothetical protein B566_EDAN012366 [Ephemera danica]|nr:hypothetical protein B566_EDAN012366 [Ephemera danica]